MIKLAFETKFENVNNFKVSSVHFDAPPELITLLLEKGATLSSRHLHWVV